MERRNFLKNTLAATPLLAAGKLEFPKKKTNLEVLVFGTNWGFEGSIDALCEKTKAAGYDGLEMWWPSKTEDQKELFEALQKHELNIGFLISGSGSAFEQHLSTYKKTLAAVLQNQSQQPIYVNCHSGKDFFEFEDNNRIIEHSIEKAAATGIPTLHETHRSRMCFAAQVTRKFLEKNPKMELTLDISHWCNVHESMLDDQKESVEAALQRSRNIHARVGHEEGPQVNDPRAPEWAYALNKHLEWWDAAVAYRERVGDKRITFLTEFGPPNYLPTLPYTKVPVANQWDINVFMLNLIKERYK